MQGRSALLWFAAAASLACGGLAGPRPENVAACTRYAGQVNQLPCVVAALHADDYCPSALDDAGCDLGPYFTCLAARTRCVDGHLDLSGQATCPLPDCNPSGRTP